MNIAFHLKAFSLVWDMDPMTPAEHVAAFQQMRARWERDKERLDGAVMMCSCSEWMTCEHPWPSRVRDGATA